MRRSRITDQTLRRCALLGLAAVLCGIGGDTDAASVADGRDGGTLVVTSDSGDYCRILSDVIEAHGTLPREIRELKVQGDGLCDQGHVRGGISRLRRALLALIPRDMTSEPRSP